MSTVSVPIRLVRDRPTWLIYFLLGTFATFVYGLSAALPLLRADQRTTATVAGLHGTAMAVGTIGAGLALPLLTRLLGRRSTCWFGLAGMNAGVLLVMATSALPLTLLGYGVAGGFGSVMLYAAMAELSDHHGPAGPAALSEANAVGVLVGMVATFVLSQVAQSALGWRSALLVTPAVSALLALALGRSWPAPRRAAGGQGDVVTGEAVPAREGGGWRFHLAGGVLFCCVALEFSFNLWAADLFALRTGVTAAVAATGLTAFVSGMAAGRFAGAQLALRLPATPLLAGALGLMAFGWVLFWASTAPILSYVGLALSGLGASLQFPLALSTLISASGDRADRAAAASPVWAGAAMAIGPLLLGALADGYGTGNAFLLVPVVIGLAVAGVLISSRRT
ncbi:MFS transporter [Actinomadura sp. ATCC 39365]|uniref:MFS transporter n=1 Tax=Nonomuraea sp. NPDC005692 TaxID=3157168 RepID=UPI0033D6A9FE